MQAWILGVHEEVRWHRFWVSDCGFGRGQVLLDLQTCWVWDRWFVLFLEALSGQIGEMGHPRYWPRKKKLGRSRRQRNLSIAGKLVTSRSRSSSLKGNSPASMSWSKEKYARKEQALALRKRIMGTPTSSTTSIEKVGIPSAMMQITGGRVLELWHHKIILSLKGGLVVVLSLLKISLWSMHRYSIGSPLLFQNGNRENRWICLEYYWSNREGSGN